VAENVDATVCRPKTKETETVVNAVYHARCKSLPVVHKKQEGCRYASNESYDVLCRRIGSYHFLHGSFRRRAMSADDLDVWINYLLEGKQ